MSVSLPEPFDHPSWLTAVWTFVSYGVVLFVLFLVLFVVPYLVVLAIGTPW